MGKDDIRTALLGATLAGAALTATALLASSVAQAAETVTYRYDARGRLVKVERSGTVNANVNTAYSYDKANNRTNRTVTGAP